jgi:hypothetical protein
MIEPDDQKLIDGISREISKRLRQLCQEESHPVLAVDDSDDTMKRLRFEISELRTIRVQLEETFSGRSHYAKGVL